MGRFVAGWVGLVALGGCVPLPPMPYVLDATGERCYLPWRIDADGDGVGSERGPRAYELSDCQDPGPGFVLVDEGVDCNDADPNVHPFAPDACDGVDWNCDGEDSVDDPRRVRRYQDRDRDGYGVGPARRVCPRQLGFADLEGDCDDGTPAVHPGAADVPCDAVDQDCDGVLATAAVVVGTEGFDSVQAAVDAGDGGGVEVAVCRDRVLDAPIRWSAGTLRLHAHPMASAPIRVSAPPGQPLLEPDHPDAHVALEHLDIVGASALSNRPLRGAKLVSVGWANGEPGASPFWASVSERALLHNVTLTGLSAYPGPAIVGPLRRLDLVGQVAGELGPWPLIHGTEVARADLRVQADVLGSSEALMRLDGEDLEVNVTQFLDPDPSIPLLDVRGRSVSIRAAVPADATGPSFRPLGRVVARGRVLVEAFGPWGQTVAPDRSAGPWVHLDAAGDATLLLSSGTWRLPEGGEHPLAAIDAGARSSLVVGPITFAAGPGEALFAITGRPWLSFTDVDVRPADASTADPPPLVRWVDRDQSWTPTGSIERATCRDGLEGCR